MKKTYTKPELFCEEYELTTAIAGTCSSAMHAYNVNASSYLQCSYKIGLDYLFVETNSACDTFPEVDGDYNVCYQIPTDSSMVFSS